MTTGFNLVQQRQETDPLGASEKVRKGSASRESEDLMPFACVMESAQRMAPLEKGEIHLGPPGKEEKQGRSDKGKAIRREVSAAADPKNIPGAEKGKTEKTDQSLSLKDSRLAGGPHAAALKGGAAKEIKLFVSASRGDEEAKNLKLSMHASDGGKAVKGLNPSVTVSGEKGTKTRASSPGTIAVLPHKDGQERIAAGKSLPENGVLKGGKTEKIRPLAEDQPRVLKTGVQKTGIQAGIPEAATAGMAVGKDDIHAKRGGARVADPAGKDIGNQKGIVAAFRNGGIRESEAGGTFRVADGAPGPLVSDPKRAAAVKGKIAAFRNEGNGTGKNFHAAGDASEPLKSALKDTASAKAKHSSEKGGAERVSYASARESGRHTIENQQGLRDETAGVGDEEAGVKKTHDHPAGVLHREAPQLAFPPERDSSVGGYQHTTLHTGGRPAAVSENVGITPRALIDQIADGAKMSGRVRIALNPPNLGTLDMDVLVRDNKVHVVLQTENNDVKQMLQSNVESLKGSLRSQGLIADTIQVFAQEKSDGGNYGSGRNEAFFGDSSNRGRNERDREGGSDFPNHVSPMPEEETRRIRGDGHISVFA